MIDAHCHLYSDKYHYDLREVIQRAQEKLQLVVISAVDQESLRKSLAIRRKYPDFIRVTAGVHPRSAAKLNKEELTELWQAIGTVKEEIVALGEVGPDFYHVKDNRLRQRQLSVLEDAMEQAQAMDLPLVIHARQAEKAALEVVARSRIPILFHCFAATRQMAKEITAHGFYLSFSAILLFSSELQRAVTEVPLELILTETDSPALSPQGNQRRNEPAFLESIVSQLANLLDYPVGKVGSITAANAERFYGIAHL